MNEISRYCATPQFTTKPTLVEDLKEIGKPTPEQKPNSGQEYGNLLRGIARTASNLLNFAVAKVDECLY